MSALEAQLFLESDEEPPDTSFFISESNISKTSNHNNPAQSAAPSQALSVLDI